MLRISIPPAALEAGTKELFAREEWVIPWDELEEYDRDFYREQARATFEAMVAAWPEMEIETWVDRRGAKGKDVILPMPQVAAAPLEGGDE